MNKIEVYYEATPNPQTMKFVVTQILSDRSQNYTSQAETANSPLASKIFGFPWAAGVFIGPNFVTITKQEWVDWQILADPLSDLIKEHLERNEPIFVELAGAELGSKSSVSEHDDSDSDSPLVKEIKKILNIEIRPAVAMDGGDILFHKYENGRVYLHMRGSCSGCPSATITLKEGIESRLRKALPEIQEVVSV